MGYDLHVHRREDWLDDGNDIQLEEWSNHCASDPALCLSGSAEADSLIYNNNGCAVWTMPESTRQFWFDLNRGEISVKSPDTVTIRKVCEIADALSARVQGDDGEFYRPDGTTFEAND